MTYRVRFAVAGGHVHCRLFFGPSESSGALCGSFCVRRGMEFRLLLEAFRGAEFIGDDPEVGIVVASKD